MQQIIIIIIIIVVVVEQIQTNKTKQNKTKKQSIFHGFFSAAKLRFKNFSGTFIEKKKNF